MRRDQQHYPPFFDPSVHIFRRATIRNSQSYHTLELRPFPRAIRQSYDITQRAHDITNSIFHEKWQVFILYILSNLCNYHRISKNAKRERGSSRQLRKFLEVDLQFPDFAGISNNLVAVIVRSLRGRILHIIYFLRESPPRSKDAYRVRKSRMKLRRRERTRERERERDGAEKGEGERERDRWEKKRRGMRGKRDRRRSRGEETVNLSGFFTVTSLRDSAAFRVLSCLHPCNDIHRAIQRISRIDLALWLLLRYAAPRLRPSFVCF